MLPQIRSYLDEVRLHLHLDTLTEKQAISELYTYFQERIAELQERGIPEREAIRRAIKSFGRPRVIARLTYEAHSKGNWNEAVLSALPHLIVAGLFATHLWHHPILASLVFASIVYVALFGWWHGKPNWLYSWIGYSLLPLLIGDFASRATIGQTVSVLFGGHGSWPSLWSLLFVGVLYTLSVGIIIRTTLRVVKRDWVPVSLMLVPLPIVGSWLFNVERVGGLFQSGGVAFYQWDALMALVLVTLAIASATFIRVRPRVVKIGALLTLSVIAVTMAVPTLWGVRGFWGFLLAALLSFTFLLGPALLEAKIGHGESRGGAWWSDVWVERPSTIR